MLNTIENVGLHQTTVVNGPLRQAVYLNEKAKSMVMSSEYQWLLMGIYLHINYFIF